MLCGMRMEASGRLKSEKGKAQDCENAVGPGPHMALRYPEGGARQPFFSHPCFLLSSKLPAHSFRTQQFRHFVLRRIVSPMSTALNSVASSCMLTSKDKHRFLQKTPLQYESPEREIFLAIAREVSTSYPGSVIDTLDVD